MSYVNVYIHTVFGTKHRFPILDREKRELLFDHIKEHAKDNNILIGSINGHDDHIHILIKLNAAQCIADVMHLIKGESSRWTNQQQLFQHRLIWARGYYARSVDKDKLYLVKRYIQNQDKHQQAFKEVEEYLKYLVPKNSMLPKENNLFIN